MPVENEATVPRKNWQHQATAFLARCRAQMWGKHKEEPLAWLYRAGFSVSFAQDHFLGWNFRPMQRNAALWLGEDRAGEKYALPQGLLLPWIQESQMLRLSILGMEGDTFILEGSSLRPLVAEKGPCLLVCASDGDAFRLLQETKPGTAVMAAPDFSLLRPSDFEGFGRIRLVTPFTDDARRLLDELRSQGRMAQAFPLPERGLVSGLLSGELSFSRIPAMALF
jgi:hypothetical protein